jgi:FG-GAP-like repeat
VKPIQLEGINMLKHQYAVSNTGVACHSSKDRHRILWTSANSVHVGFERPQLEPLEQRTLLSGLPFLSPTSFAVGSDPVSVAVGDFKGDGTLDLAVANRNSNNVSVLLGNGNGTFLPAVNYPVGNEPYSVTVADLNGDGTMDLVVANYASNSVSVLFGNGNGTFKSQQTFSVGNGPDSIAVADLSDDGIMDILTGDRGSPSVSILMGDGNGTFQPVQFVPVGYIVQGSPNPPYGNPNSIALADLTGDGSLDLVAGDFGTNGVNVLFGNGDGTFQSNLPYLYNAGLGITAVGVAELGNGQNQDIVTTNFNSNSVSVLLGSGSGSFLPQNTYKVGNHPLALTIADVNLDGIPDIVTANAPDGTVSVLEGNGNGTFQTQQTFMAGSYPDSVAVADLTGNGEPDLIVADGDSDSVTVLLNAGPPIASQLAIDSAPASATAGTATSVVVNVEDPAGNTITSDSTEVTLSVASGPSGATISGTTTVAAVNGVATFSNVILTVAGNYELNATDGTLTAAASNTISVAPSVATQLVFADRPTDITAGGSLSADIVVDAEDAYDNIATSYNSDVTLGAKIAPPGYTFTPIPGQAVDGVATFSSASIGSLDTAGGYKLKATETGLTSGKSSKFFVQPAAAAKLVFVDQPTDITAGSAEGPIIVAVEDEFGNILTDDDTTMVMLGLKVTPPGEAFTAIAVLDDDGIGLFSDVILTTPGGYKFKATSSGIAPGKSVKLFVSG